MNNFSFSKYSNQVWILVLAVVMAACSQFEAQGPSDDVTLEEGIGKYISPFSLDPLGLENARTTTGGAVGVPGSPVEGGGNVSCNSAIYEFSSGRIDDEDIDLNDFGGLGIQITRNADKSISFDLSGFVSPIDGLCLGSFAFIVKGGSNPALVYSYPAGTISDSGLFSPLTGGDGSPVADLSNLTFCYNLVPCVEEKCWDDETAWARGYRFTARGNWAMYFDGPTQTAIDATPVGGIIPLPKIGGGTSNTKTLLAGQTLEAGTFKLIKTSNPDEFLGIIIINQFQGLNGIVWRFAPVSENVKIEKYTTAPSGNPAPGLFSIKGTAPNFGNSGNEFRINIPKAKFYAVHVDFEREVECPDNR